MKAHPHYNNMALYLEDAAETDKPWERWEFLVPTGEKWWPHTSCPSWLPNYKYRRIDQYRKFKKALAEGKTIQISLPNCGNGWWVNIVGEPLFRLPPERYRVKPEPKEKATINVVTKSYLAQRCILQKNTCGTP